jgi:hypothetical protein
MATTVLSTANFINRAPEWKDLYAADASCSREADMKRLMVVPPENHIRA